MRLLRFVKVNAQEYRIGGAFTFSIGKIFFFFKKTFKSLAFFQNDNIVKSVILKTFNFAK